MNETLRSILNRRSVRKYNTDQLTDKDLQDILQAGKFAPSAFNGQPWHFTVLQNKGLIEKINKICKCNMGKSNDENLDLFYDAPTLIIVSSDKNVKTSEFDCSMAIENMFLAAESLNIGSCFIYSIKYLFLSENGKALRSELYIPETYDIIASAVFGYKACVTIAPCPRKEGTINVIR